jgi:trimethylamine--corrinoid protein Co-methyltransferase
MTHSTDSNTTRRSRRGRGQPRERDASGGSARIAADGGRFMPLSADQADTIRTAAIDILARIGMGEAPPQVVTLVCNAGGSITENGRLLFPVDLVERCLAALPREVTLCGQADAHDLVLSDSRVHVGTGGAAPSIVDIETGRYRDSVLNDLYQAARLADALQHVHFYSRSLVARDMSTPEALELNTAFACLAGTSKHVCVSASSARHVELIAKMCFMAAGSREAFERRPFLSLNVNHAVPPLRFDGDSCEVLLKAVELGIPVMVNTFGQMGASSPVTVAGCVAQTTAETLAGMVIGWLANPSARLVFGPRPMITDLRTGAMSGGSGEQALLTAASIQMARHLGLPNSTIAGATDSKIADAQAGYEKALNVALAAQAGCNFITQACGMQAGLMAASLESYVIDNDMLGSILKSLSVVEVSDATLALGSIADVVAGEGHFLGQPDTLARMSSDFLYPQVADRQPPAAWEQAGSPDIRSVAIRRTKELLASHFPDHLSRDLQTRIRDEFDIRLPEEAMRAS